MILVSGSSHTDSDSYHYELLRPDLYTGLIDVTPADMPNLYDRPWSDIDEKNSGDEI